MKHAHIITRKIANRIEADLNLLNRVITRNDSFFSNYIFTFDSIISTNIYMSL